MSTTSPCGSSATGSSSYEPEGTLISLSNLRVYATGPTSYEPGRGLILITNICGISSHSLQAADLLSASTDSLVLVPDYLNGGFLRTSVMPPGTEDKTERPHSFIGHETNFEISREITVEVLRAAKQRFPHVKSWGVLGLCWGGKLTALASLHESPERQSRASQPGYIIPLLPSCVTSALQSLGG